MKRSGIFIGLFCLLTSACGISSAIDDAQKAQAAAAAKNARGSEGFKSAVSATTGVVFKAAGDAMSEAMTANSAPAYSPETFKSLVESSGNINVNTTVETHGGTVVVKGTITWKVVGTASSATIDETFDLTVDFKDLKIDIDGKTYTCSGSEKVTGSIHIVVEGVNVDWSGKIVEKGNFTLDADKYDFDVTITLSNKGGSYAGTVNGTAVSGSVERPAGTQDNQNGNDNDDTGNVSHGTADANGMACDYPTTAECRDYTGAYYSSATIASSCPSPAVQVTSCTTAGRVGHCVIGGATAAEYTVSYYSTSNAGEAYCSGVSGVWSAN